MEEAIEVPVDDSALSAIEDALDAAYGVDESGAHILERGDFTLSQLLNFWSGHDPSEARLAGYVGDAEVYEHPRPVLHPNDLIRALVAEIRRMRGDG